jgi:hypothetical protein
VDAHAKSSRGESAVNAAVETKKPVGVSGAEYRRQWNRLNRDRLRLAGRRYYANHPEKRRKIPTEVTAIYRAERRRLNKPHYYRDWKKAANRLARWTVEDSRTLIEFTGTDRELSAVLGRSISAIQKRRHLLRQDSDAVAILQSRTTSQ